MPTLGTWTSITATNFNAAADNTIDESTSVDLGAGEADEVRIKVRFQLAASITAAGYTGVRIAYSHDNTDWPESITGSDAGVTITDEAKSQLDLLGNMANSDTDDGNTMEKIFAVEPKARYFSIVTENQTSGTYQSGTIEYQTKDF